MHVSVIIEVGAGLALLVVPDVVIRALIGSDDGVAATVVARVLGGALVALAIAGTLARDAAAERAVVPAFVVYDVATAMILAAASLAGTASGILLWPVVALHAVLAVVLLVARVPKTSHTAR